MLIWFLRRGFWNLIAWMKFTANKPLHIPLPPTKRHVIEPKPMMEAIPEVPLRNVMVCARANIPPDERVPLNTMFYRLQVWLYTAFSPMQPGLPPIDADPQLALKRAFTRLHRTRFRAPSIWAVQTSARCQCAVRTPATPPASMTPPGSGTFACSTTTSITPGY